MGRTESAAQTGLSQTRVGRVTEASITPKSRMGRHPLYPAYPAVLCRMARHRFIPGGPAFLNPDRPTFPLSGRPTSTLPDRPSIPPAGPASGFSRTGSSSSSWAAVQPLPCRLPGTLPGRHPAPGQLPAPGSLPSGSIGFLRRDRSLADISNSSLGHGKQQAGFFFMYGRSPGRGDAVLDSLNKYLCQLSPPRDKIEGQHDKATYRPPMSCVAAVHSVTRLQGGRDPSSHFA